LGASQVETEHLLLGILRENKIIADSLHLAGASVREKIAKQSPAQAAHISTSHVSTSMDMPLSHELKRALAYGAEESERFGLRLIGPECLLLGLAREGGCFAARILSDAGVRVSQLRELASPLPPEPRSQEKTTPRETPGQDSEGFRDLTELATAGKLTPLIGRETELRRAAQILSRRTRNSIAIIGDPGVGKTALIEGLVQRFSSGALEQFADYRVLQAYASSLFPMKPGARAPKLVDQILRDLADRGQTLLAIEGLFDLALARADWGLTEASHALSPFVATGRLPCIATGTPTGLEAARAKAPELARSFEILILAEPQPAEAAQILEGLKPKYEQFHGVTFGPGAVEMAIIASARFLPQRSLPDRALDLLDEAAAYARIRREQESHELIEARREVRQIAEAFKAALEQGDFTQCRSLSDQEREAREKLRVLLEQRQNASVPSVTREDIEQVAADRTSAPLSAIRAILAKKGPADLDEILARLARHISVERNPWLPLLAAYIARASEAEIGSLIEAIRAARPNPSGS